MPPITRRFLATAAGFLVLGVVLGLVLLVRRELFDRRPEPGLVSVHAHLILVGAVMELIIGVAWWFFPRPLRDDPPASLAGVVTAWWALTAGTLLRAGAEASRTVAGGDWSGVVVAGGTLQVAGMLAAVVALRRRVRPGREPAR